MSEPNTPRRRLRSLAPLPLLCGAVFTASALTWLPLWGPQPISAVTILLILLGLALAGRGVRQVLHARNLIETRDRPARLPGSPRPGGAAYWWRHPLRMGWSWVLGGVLVLIGIGVGITQVATEAQAIAVIGAGGMVAAGYTGMAFAAEYSRMCELLRVRFTALF